MKKSRKTLLIVFAVMVAIELPYYVYCAAKHSRSNIYGDARVVESLDDIHGAVLFCEVRSTTGGVVGLMSTAYTIERNGAVKSKAGRGIFASDLLDPVVYHNEFAEVATKKTVPQDELLEMYNKAIRSGVKYRGHVTLASKAVGYVLNPLLGGAFRDMPQTYGSASVVWYCDDGGYISIPAAAAIRRWLGGIWR